MDSSDQPFKPDDWIIFQNLQASKELNGQLGQVLEYNIQTQRYSVFVPQLLGGKTNKPEEVDDDIVKQAAQAFNVHSPSPQPDPIDNYLTFCRGEKTDQLHHATAEALFMALDKNYVKTKQKGSCKLVRSEKLKHYKNSDTGEDMEKLFTKAWIVRGSQYPPCGKMKTISIPKIHPMFQISRDHGLGNSPMWHFYGCPLITVKLPSSLRSDRNNRGMLINQVGTYLNVNAHTGFAPIKWQDFVGDIIVFRPNPKHKISDVDMDVIWQITAETVGQYEPDDDGNYGMRVGEKEGELNPEWLEVQIRNYLSDADDFNQASYGILNGTESQYTDLSVEERMHIVEELENNVRNSNDGLGRRFDEQNIVEETRRILVKH